jgi:hypothetical protein
MPAGLFDGIWIIDESDYSFSEGLLLWEGKELNETAKGFS